MHLALDHEVCTTMINQSLNGVISMCELSMNKLTLTLYYYLLSLTIHNSYIDENIKQWAAYEAKTNKQELDVEIGESYDGSPDPSSTVRESTLSSSSSTANNHLNNKRTCVHEFFVFYSFLGGITAILLALAQCIGFTIQDIPTDFDLGLLHYCISILLLMMCAVSVVTELEWCNCLVSCVLRFWVTRGLVYVGMGYLSLYQLRKGGGSKDQNQTYFIEGVSYTFMGVGAGYTLMGLLCFQKILERIRLDYRARKYGYKTSNVDKETDRIPDCPTDLVFDDDEKEFT